MSNELSQWDLKYLDADQQKTAIDYKTQWGTDPLQQTSLHTALEEIRATKGYSGGPDGSQYIPIEQFNAPEAPVIGQWKSPRETQLTETLDKIITPPTYNNDYGKLLNQQISSLVNRSKFEYDPTTDVAYQAFKKSALAAGDKAYNDNLGGLSAMTGGRANSWAGAVASQARNQYTLQAEEAVTHFEDRAYSRYRDETQDMYNLTNLLQSQDDKAYARFRDTVGDTKDLANMLIQLDDREFEKYKYMADNQWKTFESEYNSYNDSLQFKKDKIAEAIDRTNLSGFVNNQDSIILGVPTGTLSQAARERAEQMEDYIKKTEIDIDKDFKMMEKTHQYDIKIMDAKEKIDKNIREEQERRDLRMMSAEEQQAYRMMNAQEQKDYRMMSAQEKQDYRMMNAKFAIENGNSGVYGNGYEGLGSVAAKYESNGNPGTVSSGAGDNGGISYGIYQFSSKTGGVNNFLNFLKTNNPGYYNELSKAGKPGSSGFSAKWKQIAERDPGGFASLQQQAIQKQYYEPAVASVKKTTGIDVSTRSPALQEAIWSTAIQHGSGSVAKIVQRALNTNPSGKTDDAALINAIYDERGAGNGSKYFPSSSKSVQQSVANRFKSEKKDVLALLNTGTNKASNATSPTNLVQADGKKRDQLVNDYTKYTAGKDFQRLSNTDKKTYINKQIDRILKDYNDGLLGKNGTWIANEALGAIKASESYKKYVEGPEVSQGYATYYDQLKKSDIKDSKPIVNKGGTR